MPEVAEQPLIDQSLDAEQIIKLAERRLQRYDGRDRLYEIYSRYYFGEQRGMGSPSTRAASSTGRPLMRDLESSMNGGDSEYRSQRLAPIVDDAQALLGRMPSSRVEPPDSGEAGLARGVKLTKYLVSSHELSRMDRQQAEMGWQLPCLGDSCYLLDIQKVDRAWRVVWNVVDPRSAYPAFLSGFRRFDVLDLIIREYWDPYEAAAKFGSSVVKDIDGPSVPVTIYISAYQRTVVAGEGHKAVVVRHTPWNLPFCPAVWVFNKLNGRMAQSDIASSLIQQDALDFMTTVMLDAIVLRTYSIPVLKNPTNIGQDGIVYGPNAPPVTVGTDGDLKFVNTQTDLTGIQQGMDDMTKEIYSATGSSQVRQEGTMHSSIPTGRAMHAAQGPQATRIELKQQELGAAVQIANAMTLEMQEKGPHIGSQTFEIFGRLRGKSFLEKFSPKDDIDGWYRNSVHWEPVTGMNLQQKTSVAYEAKAAKLIDSERAMELMGEDDPMGMIERVRAETLRDAELQARIQGMMQPGAPPPGGGGPSGGGPAPSQGGPPPPTMIARPPGMGAPAGGGPPGLPTGVPNGVNREAVSKALALVADKLKGTVAVVGELAATGESKHIEVLISEYKDFGKVAPVLRALDPKATIKAVDEAKWPDEAVRVA